MPYNRFTIIAPGKLKFYKHDKRSNLDILLKVLIFH